MNERRFAGRHWLDGDAAAGDGPVGRPVAYGEPETAQGTGLRGQRDRPTRSPTATSNVGIDLRNFSLVAFGGLVMHQPPGSALDRRSDRLHRQGVRMVRDPPSSDATRDWNDVTQPSQHRARWTGSQPPGPRAGGRRSGRPRASPRRTFLERTADLRYAGRSSTSTAAPGLRPDRRRRAH